MGSCREILTLQLGSYANYVGAHFWNLQETSFNYNPAVQSEICHGITYREGVTLQGDVTFTPRLICVDKKKNSAPIPLLEDSSEAFEPSSRENLQLIESPTLSKHAFIKDLDECEDVTNKNYEFENSLRDWGDMLRARLHPLSVVTNFQDNTEEIEDKIRIFIEECDNLQGFHILLDSNEIYSSVLCYLDDEFSSKIRLTFPVVSGVGEITWKDAATRLIRTFINFHDSAQFSSLTVPLGCSQVLSMKPEVAHHFQDLIFDLNCNYHTSAILASFLEAVSVPYRKQTRDVDLFEFTSGLTTRSWKFSSASISLPFPIGPGMTLLQSLESRDDAMPLWSSLTPGATVKNSLYQTFGLRGASDGNVLLQYLQYLTSSVSNVSAVATPMPTLQPFPKLFSEHVSIRGSVDPTASRMPGFDVLSSPVLGGLHASVDVGDMIKSFANLVNKINRNKLPQLEIENDAFTDSVNSMLSFAKDLSLDADME